MNTVLGANWLTTLSGWIAVLASAVAINPGLVAFLPEPVRTYVTGLAGVVAVLSGGTFATQAKDRNVTGGTVANDGCSTRQITPLIAAALLPLFALSGCAWAQIHRAQINDTSAVISQRALNIAERVLISVAANAADKNFKADFLDSVAVGLRQNEATVVNAEDVAKIVRIWSPNDGAQWQALAGSLGSMTGLALETAGNSHSAAIVENIARGLNEAAAAARTATATK